MCQMGLLSHYISQEPLVKYTMNVGCYFVNEIINFTEDRCMKRIFHLAMTKSEYVVRKKRLHVLGVSSSTQLTQAQAGMRAAWRVKHNGF